MIDDSQIIQDHESPLRKMVSDSQGNKYKAIETLEEAKMTKNVYLIMEGDDGGQIYLVAPVTIVGSNEKTLKDLLKFLDARKWGDMSMARLYYEVHELDTNIPGGMGGGNAEKDLWVHEEFKDIKDKIEEVIKGKSEAIS